MICRFHGIKPSKNKQEKRIRKLEQKIQQGLPYDFHLPCQCLSQWKLRLPPEHAIHVHIISPDMHLLCRFHGIKPSKNKQQKRICKWKGSTALDLPSCQCETLALILPKGTETSLRARLLIISPNVQLIISPCMHLMCRFHSIEPSNNKQEKRIRNSEEEQAFWHRAIYDCHTTLPFPLSQGFQTPRASKPCADYDPVMCRFHGIEPSKNKQEKRIRKWEEEQAVRKAAASEQSFAGLAAQPPSRGMYLSQSLCIDASQQPRDDWTVPTRVMCCAQISWVR